MIITLGVFSDRFNFEKSLQHFSERDIADSINSWVSFDITPISSDERKRRHYADHFERSTWHLPLFVLTFLRTKKFKMFAKALQKIYKQMIEIAPFRRSLQLPHDFQRTGDLCRHTDASTQPLRSRLHHACVSFSEISTAGSIPIEIVKPLENGKSGAYPAIGQG